MENKVYLILRNTALTTLGLSFLCGSYFVFKSSEIFIGVLLFTIGVTFFSIGLFFDPWYYVFDINGVSICYLFNRKHRFLWKKINAVILNEERIQNGNIYIYDILGTPENEPCFYMRNKIIKNGKTEKMLEEYFDCGLVDFTKKLKIKLKFKHFKEISEMEKYQQTQTEKYISHYRPELANIGLCLKTAYAYLSDKDEDIVEYSVIPKGNSTYSAILRVSRPDETDKNKIFEFDVALIDFFEEKDRVRATDNGIIVGTLSVFDELVKEIELIGIDKFSEDDNI